ALQTALDIVLLSNNLGDAQRLLTHPAPTPHKHLSDEARAELGIGPGTLRLSVGLEDADDLLEDIAQALKAR
ncbi:O-succinylhomoserine sulfhydrylase, partial [Mesorhizobium sp. M7A.F.Ca.CA.002.09.1.1]|uniref:PLP-dependent transferase n=1 Tax=Mesorhizobium sp. M7A.F.Ca.CA.002.09.1.1 TaxID=2496739 RepID=UPI000FD5B8E9